MYFWNIHSHTELVIVRRQLLLFDLLQTGEGKPALMHHLGLQNTVCNRHRTAERKPESPVWFVIIKVSCVVF